MRFMLFMIPHVYQPDAPPEKQAQDGFTPPAEAVAKMMKFSEDLAKAGALMALDGLHPIAKGARVRFLEGRTKISEGPFSHAKEVIGGYWLIQARSMEEAVGWAKRCPASDGDIIEIRQVFETTDFPPEAQKAADNPVVRRQVERQRVS